MKRFLAVATATMVLGAGCGGNSPSRVSLDLHIENGTTKAITVLVDGTTVRTVGAGQSATVSEATLPAGVWSVEARLPGGTNVLKSLIDRSVVSQTANGASGSGSRVDLSCGRLDVWVGVPMLGPVPRPGTPGDCDG